MTDEAQNDFPEAWRPDPGDTITGTLSEVQMIDPNGQGAYPCVTLKTAEGLTNIHAFHQVLQRGIARRRPKVGDELTITYQGKREGGTYGSYHSYQVSGGQDQEVNWDAFLPEDERRARQQADAEPPIAPSEPFVPPESFQPKPPPTGEQFGDEPPF